MAQPQVPKISSFERTLETVVVASKKISTFPTHIFEESSGGRRLFDRFIYSRVSNKGTCTTIYFSEKIHPVRCYWILYVYSSAFGNFLTALDSKGRRIFPLSKTEIHPFSESPPPGVSKLFRGPLRQRSHGPWRRGQRFAPSSGSLLTVL